MERELPDYIKRLQAVLAADQAEWPKRRAHLDRQFFELNLHIYILFEMLRRRADRLEMRIAKLEDAAQTVEPNQKEVRLPYWALN
jgi:asparagine synthetase B (glutamine-hydrolysing)